ALRLLVSSFGSESALTNAFIRGPKQEQNPDIVSGFLLADLRRWLVRYAEAKIDFGIEDAPSFLLYYYLLYYHPSSRYKHDTLPITAISVVSVLNELKVPFSDIEERTVHVGKQKALRLRLSSFVSESALTNAFIK
ncbi:hypothetical protein TIFTF001_043269, partial [Ficus carica]